MERQNFATFIGISRHRLATDGKGVTTLAAFMDARLIAIFVSIHNVRQKAPYCAPTHQNRCMPN